MIRWLAELFCSCKYMDSETVYLLEDLSDRIDELEEQIVNLELRVDNITHAEYNLKSFSLGE